MEKSSGILMNISIAFVLRLGLMLYGMWQDATMLVKFTDVDYNVFTDAASFVVAGESPFRRGTYRYTPLLAWILTPNITVHPLWGKLIFIVCDVLTGYIIYKICRSNRNDLSTSLLCAQVWLYNPLPMTVSSRGNAESIMSVLTLATVYLLSNNSTRNLCFAAIIYGLSVHVKIYPITYSLSIYLFLNSDYSGDDRKSTSFLKYALPNKSRLLFIALSAGIFVLLTGICYFMYGYEFLYETYLYHIVRKDTRHNFSAYFYMLYITGEMNSAKMLGLLAFLPQLILLLLISVKFHRDLQFCFFVQTFVFVTFNKVCTSQYFLWYLAFLPLLIPRLTLSTFSGATLAAVWFLGQAVWLSPAFYLEFEGVNSFLLIWMGGLSFLVINVWILAKIIISYQQGPQFEDGKRQSWSGSKLCSLGILFMQFTGMKEKLL